MAQQKGLGKGLDALFADNVAEVGGERISTVSLSLVEPNPSQARKQFDREALEELADSIRQHGILTPLLVRPVQGGGFQIIAGERRWRAARMAELTEIPVIIKDTDETSAAEISLIENLQRRDLNPIEEAEGFAQLIGTFGLTQEQAATRVGKSRSSVTNALRLLALPRKTLDFLRSGALSVGHAKVLLGLSDAEQIDRLAAQTVEHTLSVRELEGLLKQQKTKKDPVIDTNVDYYKALSSRLEAILNRGVKISGNQKKGRIEIEYYGNEDLEQLTQALSRLR
ncbi:MAG: ParB/RepB/Spo0J family partition protein [Clostridia bacterium]|nr:ParB/RepB/Spo0J family partition protein [Clostridia bacterium]